jgi:hypothetical protein
VVASVEDFQGVGLFINQGLHEGFVAGGGFGW